MGERKVQCKYFPPDFDPKLLPKRNNFRDEQIKVRIMIPFTVQCTCCGEFIYRGTKFTSRKEDIPLEEEEYLGLRKFRFYIKCGNCLQEIVFKTDPKNSDYEMEQGATRNYEPWKQTEEIERLMEEERENEEKGDTMRQLENRTEESKRAMDILDALEEIKELNARKSQITEQSILDGREQKTELLAVQRAAQEEQEVEAAAALFNEKKSEVLKRLDSDSDHDDKPSLFAMVNQEQEAAAAAPAGGLMMVVKKRKKDKKEKKSKKDKKNKKDKKRQKREG